MRKFDFSKNNLKKALSTISLNIIIAYYKHALSSKYHFYDVFNSKANFQNMISR